MFGGCAPVDQCRLDHELEQGDMILLVSTSQLMEYIVYSGLANTGGIEKFPAKENFRKTLKVSHFCLGFSPNKNTNEIKHSQGFC